MDPTLVQTAAIICMIAVGLALFAFTVVGIVTFSGIVKRGLFETRMAPYRRANTETKVTLVDPNLNNRENENNIKHNKQKVI